MRTEKREEAPLPLRFCGKPAPATDFSPASGCSAGKGIRRRDGFYRDSTVLNLSEAWLMACCPPTTQR